jgi:hypothetical protein
MTLVLTDLITLFRERGDMRNTVRFPDSYLTKELQRAFAAGYQLIVQQNSGFFDQFDNVSTVAHQAFVALPAGPPPAWIVRRIDRQDTADFIPLPRIGIKDIQRYGTTEGRPAAHRLTARGIDLYPTPDQVYTLRVLHTPAAPTLDTTPREYYNGWDDFTLFKALSVCFKNQGRDASAWRQELADATALVITGASERDSSGPEYLNLREGPGGDSWDDELDAWRRGY